MRLIDADKLKAHYSWWDNEEKYVFDSVVDLQPTVESRPKGKWHHYTDDKRDYAECSECGYGDEGEVYLGEETNFCPNCGADMRGKE